MTPIDPISDTVVNRIAEACTRIPDHPAIVDKGGAVKLSQLWETAAALAGQLSGLPGFAREDRIGLLLPRDRSMPTAMLASMLAGGAFLPLDPSWPTERLNLILEDAGCRVLLENGLIRTAPWLRRIVIGGEALPLPLARLLFAQPAFIHLELVNMYGPAENCVNSTCFVINADKIATLEWIPLGSALPGTEILILGDGEDILPPGATGEICLTGIALARGYLNRPEATARAFLSSPHTGAGDLGCIGADGCLEFRGRQDNQVKIAGQRVELEEIEEQLKCIGSLRDIAVVYQRREHGGRLVAFVAADAPPDLAHLRAQAIELLPAYMVPGTFVHLGPALPLTHNGKVDRETLASFLASNAKQAVREDTTSGTVAHLWREILSETGSDPHIGFLALGGDSIAAIRLVAAIRSRFQSKVSLEAILSNITLAELEQLVEQSTSSTGLACAPQGNDHFSFGQAKFDLLLSAYPNREALELVLEYSTATVVPAQAQSWLRAFLELIERLTAHEH